MHINEGEICGTCKNSNRYTSSFTMFYNSKLELRKVILATSRCYGNLGNLQYKNSFIDSLV